MIYSCFCNSRSAWVFASINSVRWFKYSFSKSSNWMRIGQIDFVRKMFYHSLLVCLLCISFQTPSVFWLKLQPLLSMNCICLRRQALRPEKVELLWKYLFITKMVMSPLSAAIAFVTVLHFEYVFGVPVHFARVILLVSRPFQVDFHRR